MKTKNLILLPLFAMLLCACAPSSVEFKLAELGYTVDFHTELQTRYITSEDYLTTSGIASGSSEKSAPQGVELSWTAKPNTSKKADKYIINLYEDDQMVDTFESEEQSLTIYNLKLDTEYQYTVSAVYGNKNFTSDFASFKTTEKGPRNLYIDEVMNIRDLGGHGIKQGLIYRSARYNETDGTSKLTNSSKEALNKLKLKTEVDLRRYGENGNITTSPISPDVTYKHLPMHYGGQNVLTNVTEYEGRTYDNPAEIKKFFELLSEQSSYPLVFHCSIGKDRTGCMAYLVESLCGMTDEYLYRDYLFSNFAKIGGMCEVKDIDDKYGFTINNYEGENHQQKTYNYLRDIVGVEEAKLDSVIAILKQ